ncbi:MAG TPA: hypothetical protein VFR40_08375 [Lapillicoccus sp.]|nr:hypothetical protein [Lapillicoccus sp.]
MPREGGPPARVSTWGALTTDQRRRVLGLLLTAAAAPTLTVLWLVPGLLLFGDQPSGGVHAGQLGSHGGDP